MVRKAFCLTGQFEEAKLCVKNTLSPGFQGLSITEVGFFSFPYMSDVA